MKLWKISFLAVLLCSSLFADHQDLYRDLMVVRSIDRRLSDSLSVNYNMLGEGGYILMPSARVGPDGSVSGGYSSVPPYRNFFARLQLFERLELSGAYRIFSGVPDQILSKFGFGDFSDKGASVKVILLSQEDTDGALPSLAVGAQDFEGTKNFQAEYIVASYTWLDWDLEMSLGYGFDRMQGFFGGIYWSPLRHCESGWVNGLSLLVELDATDYEDASREKHPRGRVVNYPFNFGVRYRLFDYIDFMVAQVRGHAVAVSGSVSYPLGTTEGFLTKVKEAPPYRSPMNSEPVGLVRSSDLVVHRFIYAFQEQGFTVIEGWISTNNIGKKQLRIVLANDDWRWQRQARSRINRVIGSLTPADIGEVIVTMESEGLRVNDYVYRSENIRRYQDKEIGDYEFAVTSSVRPPTCADSGRDRLLYRSKKQIVDFRIDPRSRFYFGSSRGKFKYSWGLKLVAEGNLFSGIYYRAEVGVPLVKDVDTVTDVDILNPSQIISVRSDSINYEKQNDVMLDMAFIQRNFHVHGSLYSRIALGYFEQAYGGVVGEVLYWSLDHNWAIGCESAVLGKREFSGLGFTDQIQKLTGFRRSFTRFRPHQHMLNLYYYLPEARLVFTMNAGRFLARDIGARFELTKIFQSGFEFTVWYTRTNGKDVINGSRYFDKGVAVAVPLDIFFEKSSRRYWTYGLSAWLRDVGATADTGDKLFYTLLNERK